tara:strand:+ start:800 stop:1219 length:420 start_codon:yes stop_codon:yes gene_type:complete
MSNFYANKYVKEYSKINDNVIKDKEMNIETDGKIHHVKVRNKDKLINQQFTNNDIIKTFSTYIDQVRGPMMQKLVKIHEPQERKYMFNESSFHRTPTPYPNANQKLTKKQKRRKLKKRKNKKKGGCKTTKHRKTKLNLK